MSRYFEGQANWYNQRRGSRDDPSTDPRQRDARLQPNHSDRRQARMVSSSPYGREAATPCRTERRPDWTPIPSRDRRLPDQGWYEHPESQPPYTRHSPAERGSLHSLYNRPVNVDRHIAGHPRQPEHNNNERLKHRISRQSVDDMPGAYQQGPFPDERRQSSEHHNERLGSEYKVRPDGDFSSYQQSRQVSREGEEYGDFDYRYTHQPENNTLVTHSSRKTSIENGIEVYDYEHKSTLQANYTSSYDLTGSTQGDVSNIEMMDTLHNPHYKVDRFAEDNFTVNTDTTGDFQEDNSTNGPPANPINHDIECEPGQKPSSRVNLDEPGNLHHSAQADRPAAVSQCIPDKDENKALQLQETMVNIQHILRQLKRKIVVPAASDITSRPNTGKTTPADTPVVVRSSSTENMKMESVQENNSNNQISKASEVIDLTDDLGTGYIHPDRHSDGTGKVTAKQHHIQYLNENPPRQPIHMMPHSTNTYSSETDACVDILGVSEDRNNEVEWQECNLKQPTQQINTYGVEKSKGNIPILENDCNSKRRFQSGETHRNEYTGYQQMATPHRQRHTSDKHLQTDYKGWGSFNNGSQQKMKERHSRWDDVGKDMHIHTKQTSNECHIPPMSTQTYGSSKGVKSERKHERWESQGKDFNLNQRPVDQVFKETIVKKEPFIKTEQISPKTGRNEENGKSIVGPNTQKLNQFDDDSKFIESKKSLKDFRIPKIRRESSESFKASTKKIENLETASLNSKVSKDKTVRNRSTDEKEEKGLIQNKSPDDSGTKDENTMTVKKSPEIKENIFEKMSAEIVLQKNIKDTHQSDTDLYCKNLEWYSLDKALTEKDKHYFGNAKKEKHSKDNNKTETNLDLASNKEKVRMMPHGKSATYVASTSHSSASEDSNSSVDSNCSGIFDKLETIINNDKKKKKEEAKQMSNQKNMSRDNDHKKDRKKTTYKHDRKLDVSVKGLINEGSHMYWKNTKLLKPKVFVRRLTVTNIHNIQKEMKNKVSPPQENQGITRLAVTESANSSPSEQDGFSQHHDRQASPVLSDCDLSFSLEDGIDMELGSDEETLRQCLDDMEDDPAILIKEADQSSSTAPGMINKDIKDDKSITVPFKSDSRKESQESQSNHHPMNSCKPHLSTSNVHDKKTLISPGDSLDRMSEASIVENSDELQRKGQRVGTGSNQCAENILCDTQSGLSANNDHLNTDSPVCVVSVQIDDEELSQSILDNYSCSFQINQEDGMKVGSKINDRANSTICSERFCEGDNCVDQEDSTLLNKDKKSLECKTERNPDGNGCDMSNAKEYIDDGLPTISPPKKIPRSKGMPKRLTSRTSFGRDMPITSLKDLSKDVTSEFDNREIEGTSSMVPVEKKKTYKSGLHIIPVVKEETGHEGDVEDNLLNDETEKLLNDETKPLYNACEAGHCSDDKSKVTDSDLTQPYCLSQTENEGTCINNIQMDTKSLNDMIDTKHLEIKEEPNWMKNGYTQEPDTVFISDDDDDVMVMSVSQPIIDLCDSESENEDVEKKRISENKVDIKKELDIHDPNYWACSSPEDYSDKSDFEVNDFFRMVSSLSERMHSDTEDEKSDGLSDNELYVFSDDNDSFIASLKEHTNETEGDTDDLKTDNLRPSSIHDEPTQLFMSSDGDIELQSQPFCSQTQVEENNDIYMQDTQVDFDSTESDSNQISAIDYHSEFFADHKSLSDAESKEKQNQTVSKSHAALNQEVEDNGSRTIFIEDMLEGESLVSSDMSEDSDALFDSFNDISEQSTQKYVIYDGTSSKASDKSAAGTLDKRTHTKSYDSNSMKNMKQTSNDSKDEKILCLDDEDDIFGDYSSATQIDKNFEHIENPSTSRPEFEMCTGYEAETQDLNHDEVNEYEIATQVDERKELHETGDSLDEVETQTFDCQVDDYGDQTQIDGNVFTSYHDATQVMIDSEDYTDPQYESYLRTSSGKASSSVNDKLGIKIDHFFHTSTKKLVFADDHVFVDENKQPNKEELLSNFVKEVTPPICAEQLVNAYMQETQVDHYSSENSTDEESSTGKATNGMYLAQTQCFDEMVPPSRTDTHLDAYLQETQVDIDHESGANDGEEDAKSEDQRQVDFNNIDTTDYDQQDPYIAATQVSELNYDDDSNDNFDGDVYDLPTQMDLHEAFEVQSLVKARTIEKNVIVRKRSTSSENQSTSTAYSATSHIKSNKHAEGIPMKKRAKLDYCEETTVPRITDSSLTERDLQVQEGPLPRSKGFLDAKLNILVTDASKDDMWLSKKTMKDKGKPKSVPRKRSKSGDSSLDIKARIDKARSGLEERKMRFIANPDCIANPNKKQKSSKLVISTNNASDVDYPTLSQAISKGYPILETAMLHHTKPAAESVSGFTAEVSTSISTIVTSTVTKSISAVSSTSSRNVHVTSTSICVTSHSASNRPSTKSHSSVSSAGNQSSTKTHSSAGNQSSTKTHSSARNQPSTKPQSSARNQPSTKTNSSAGNQPSTKTHSSASSAGNQPSIKSHSSASKASNQPSIKTLSSCEVRKSNKEFSKDTIKTDGNKSRSHKGKNEQHSSSKDSEKQYESDERRKKGNQHDGLKESRQRGDKEKDKKHGSDKSKDHKHSHGKDRKDIDGRDKQRDRKLEESSRSSGSSGKSRDGKQSFSSDDNHSLPKSSRSSSSSSIQSSSNKSINHKSDKRESRKNDATNTRMNSTEIVSKKQDNPCDKPSIDSLKSSDAIKEQTSDKVNRNTKSDVYVHKSEQFASTSSSYSADERGKAISDSVPATMEHSDSTGVKQADLKDANMSSSKETIACTSLSTPTGLTFRVNSKLPTCVPKTTSNQGGPISSILKTAWKKTETSVSVEQPFRSLHNLSNINRGGRPSVNNKPVTSESLSLGKASSAVSLSGRVDEQLPPSIHGKSLNRAGPKNNRRVTWSDNVVNPNERPMVSKRNTSHVYPSTSASNLMLKIPHILVPWQTVTYPPDLMKLTTPVVWGKIIAVILKWNPSWFMEREKMEAGGMKRCAPPQVTGDLNDGDCETLFPLVDRYTSLEEYTNKFMLPLLMHETWHGIYTDWREKKNRGQLHKLPMFLNQTLSCGEKLQELYSLIGLVTQEERKKWGSLNKGDLITLRMYGKQNLDSIEKSYKDMMGVVVDVTFKHSKTMLDNICSQNAKLAKLIRPDSAQVILKVQVRKRNFVPSKSPEDPLTEIQPLSSIVAVKRQIEALASLPSSPLCRDLLYPSANSTYSDRAVASLPHDRNKLNESQSVAVNTAVKIVKHVSAVIPKICLLQGPPGTGKSYTIINIIRRIVQEKQGKCCICLTAPSHAAVDELLRKIHRMNTESENRVKINMVRLGKKNSVHPEVHRYCLDNLVQQRSRGKIPQSLEAERNSLESKISSVLKNIKGSKDRYQEQKWTNDLKRLRKDKENLDAKFQTNKNPLSAGTEMKIKWELLTGAHVIAGTLSSMGGHLLKTFLPKTNTFDCIIVDEATQATELDTLIPLQYSTSKLILVGDPEQLCPTVLSQTAQDNKFNMSLFQRLDNYFRYSVVPSHQVILLDTQYRMNTEIASFPNSYIYEGKLKSNTEHMTCNLVPYLLFDIREGEEHFSQGSRSMSNQMEAVFTAELCKYILKETKFQEKSIGIIAPYSKQKAEILQKLAERGFHRIEVSTVDGFQGKEKPIVIMSCVRAGSGSIGFVGNRNRMNVALTRAKYAMYLVGHFGALGSSDEWRALIEDARQRNKIVSVSTETYLQNIGSCLKKNKGTSSHIGRTDI